MYVVVYLTQTKLMIVQAINWSHMEPTHVGSIIIFFVALFSLSYMQI